MKIKEIEIESRPREKAICFGIDSLSSVELVAILLGSGGKGHDVLKIADEVVKKSHGLSRITEMSYRDLLDIKGIGQAQALRIMACSTIVKRALTPKIGVTIHSPEDLIEYLKLEIGKLNQECFYAFYLNRKRQICGMRKCFIGNSHECSVDQNAVFKEALQCGASAIILVHNHPSGNLLPSTEDYKLTDTFIEAGNLLGIKIMDHIIISDDSFYSIASEKNQ